MHSIVSVVKVADARGLGRMIATLMLGFWGLPASGQTALGEPEEAIIHYEDSSGLTDPVSQLRTRILRGETMLQHEPHRGYLNSLLKELGISSQSQCLVFSKTSSQNDHIGPATPRAIYFNDQVYIGWVPHGEVIDIVSADPSRGCIFFTLDQTARTQPKISRQSDCIRCHQGPKTSGVPGVLVRSVFTGPDGYPVSQIADFVSGHNSPLSRRWGGWYVTGRVENDTHLGNFSLSDHTPPPSMEPTAYRPVTNLCAYFDVHPYLTLDSDIVALLVLEHQIRMQNLLIRLNYDARLAQGSSRVGDPGNAEARPYAPAAEALLEYMLFRNETPLKGKVSGTSGFTAEFQAVGPRDRQGRSLRDFDLVHRIFRHPCSYLIYSPSFDALPAEVKTYLWSRLDTILEGRDSIPCYATMPLIDRQALIEILEDTKPEYRAWRKAHEPTAS